MSEEDPLAALSAAAAKNAGLGKPAARPGKAVAKMAVPAAKPAKSAVQAGPQRFVQRKKKVPLLVPFFIGLGILALAVPLAIFITLKVMQQEKPAPAREETILHPPGELFSNVPGEKPASKPAPVAAPADTPPPDPQ